MEHSAKKGVQVIMKRNPFIVCGILLFVLVSLSSCQTRSDIVSSAPPAPPNDAWRDVYFSETHSLSSANPCVLCDVSIQEVFEQTYRQSSSQRFILLDCAIKHIFFQSPLMDSNLSILSAGDPIFLWVDVTGYDSDTISLLSHTFGSIDSAIIFGYPIKPHIVQDSVLSKQFEADLSEDQIKYYYDEGSSLLQLPPCVKVYNLEEWSVIPIVEDCFSADSITSIIGANNMAFSFDSTNPDGLQYFKTGDDIHTVYDALDKFVSKFTSFP